MDSIKNEAKMIQILLMIKQHEIEKYFLYIQIKNEDGFKINFIKIKWKFIDVMNLVMYIYKYIIF